MRTDRTATLPLATVAAAGASHPGRLREHNEDRFHVDAAEGVFLVVDGVGGEAAGEIAAEVAVHTIVERLGRHDAPAETRIREAITLANQQILQNAASHPGRSGMACVLTVAVLEGRQLTVGHVGDSRLYKLTPQGIAKLTHDHSPVGEREDAREISETEAMHHARRNEVYRDVGSEPREPDASNFIEIVFSDLPDDCAILLCSDGLSDMVTSLEINRLVRRHAERPEDAVAALIAAANEAGGRDNVTVVFAAGRDFARHAPATPIVISPPASGVRNSDAPTLPLDAGSAAPADEPGAASGAPPPEPGVVKRTLRSRTLALLAGASLGIAAGLYTDLLERPSAARRLVVGGPAGTFATIGEAVAAARPGDEVLVEPGEYAEQIYVRPGISLVSRVADAAVLVAQPGSTPWVAITAGPGPGSLRGFRIAGRPQGTVTTGVRLQGDGFEIENSTFEGLMEVGIDIDERAASTTVLANRFGISGIPVRVGGATAPMLRRNVFASGGDARLPAIEMSAAAAPRLEDNVFSQFAHPVLPLRRDLPLPPGNLVVPPGSRR